MNTIMRVAICEDILCEAEELKEKLMALLLGKNYPGLIDIFQSGEELLNSDKKYDLVVIDCKLPGINGIELAKHYRQKHSITSIIFVTSYMEYAAEGYETNALRYLLKPIDNDKLSEAFDAFIEQYNNVCYVVVRPGSDEYVVRSDEILYIESLGKRTVVRLKDRSIETTKALNIFEKEITDSNFFRTSRQFIVNISYISKRLEHKLYIGNEEIATISHRKLADFKKCYMCYLKRNF